MWDQDKIEYFEPEKNAEKTWTSKPGEFAWPETIVFSIVLRDHLQKEIEKVQGMKEVTKDTHAWLRKEGIFQPYYCGYVKFNRQMIPNAREFEGITSFTTYADMSWYFPVHGGISLIHENPDGSWVYGFDCNHWEDWTRPHLKDLDWLTNECEILACGLLWCFEFWSEFEGAKTYKEAYELCQYMQSEIEKNERY